MVGGAAETLEKVMPVFQAMGKTVTLVGEAGAGQIAKAANQIMAAAQMVAMSELMIFSQKAGADPRKVVEAIRGGAAQCWTLEVKPPRLFAGNRQPGFKAHMQAKDLNIVLDTAREYGIPLPSAAWMPSSIAPCSRWRWASWTTRRSSASWKPWQALSCRRNRPLKITRRMGGAAPFPRSCLVLNISFSATFPPLLRIPDRQILHLVETRNARD